MVILGQIQILCGAWADQAAHESAEQGVFTKALLAALDEPHERPLLDLPLNLTAWNELLPVNLLKQKGVQILDDARDVVVSGAATRSAPPDDQQATAV